MSQLALKVAGGVGVSRIQLTNIIEYKLVITNITTKLQHVLYLGINYIIIYKIALNHIIRILG
ncbi:MAG: hypothetical protein ABGX07_16630, partial [Pirellulaceae bacterium]